MLTVKFMQCWFWSNIVDVMSDVTTSQDQLCCQDPGSLLRQYQSERRGVELHNLEVSRQLWSDIARL